MGPGAERPAASQRSLQDTVESNREKIGLDQISCVPFLGYNLVKQNFRGLARKKEREFLQLVNHAGGGGPSDEARSGLRRPSSPTFARYTSLSLR